MALAGALVTLAGLLLLLPGDHRTPHSLVWVVEKTTAVAGAVPDGLRAAAAEAATDGGGTLVAYPVGPDAVRLTPVSLSVEEFGDTIADPARRAAVLERRLAELGARLDAAGVGDHGFNLYAALSSMADEATRTDGPLDVWFSTTVLTGSVDPLRIAALTAGDPAATVAELMRGPVNRLRLDGVTLHPVLLVPIGQGQQPLSAADEAWRADFLVALGRALGATVLPPLRGTDRVPPWSSSAIVPPVVPIPVASPALPCGSGGPCAIDNVAFVPNSARLLDEPGARRRVTGFVAGLPADRGFRIRVDGYTAAFGDPASSRALSLDRARVIADLLTAAGVDPGDVELAGHGFDEPADPGEARATPPNA